MVDLLIGWLMGWLMLGVRAHAYVWLHVGVYARGCVCLGACVVVVLSVRMRLCVCAYVCVFVCVLVCEVKSSSGKLREAYTGKLIQSRGPPRKFGSWPSKNGVQKHTSKLMHPYVTNSFV